MSKKKNINKGYPGIASISAVVMVLFLGIIFIIETQLSASGINLGGIVIVILIALGVLAASIRYTPDTSKQAFTVPFILFLYYTIIMIFGGWRSPYYLLVCLSFCGISCMYYSFSRTVNFIILHNIILGFLIFRGVKILGQDTDMITILVIWIICILSEVFMLLMSRSATVELNIALERQESLNDLLSTTENYVAMVDESNKIVYSSKTLAKLGHVEEPAMIAGRPLLDIFPGRNLKLLVQKMLKEKDSYAGDWEFSLGGQKRYFKAASNSISGGAGGTLITLYDMTHLAERDEIAAMKDSLKIGFFFMDKNYIIQDHYSRYLEEMLTRKDIAGELFTDIISDSVTASQLESIKDYFGMIIESTFDQETLEDINPMNELYYVNAATRDQKIFQCGFATVDRGQGEIFILVTVYDITTRVELQKRLQEEENKRQEEMQSVFEVIQVEPSVLNDFLDDMDYEFDRVDDTLKDSSLSAHDALVDVYQSIHAIKSNAVILGLNIFGSKVHNLEAKIKVLREKEGEIPFVEMLNLTMDIEKVSQEREGFRTVIEKIQSYSGSTANRKQNVNVLIDALIKTTDKAAEDMNKQVRLVTSDIDPEAIDKSPRRVLKEVLMQLIRNSVVHGVEMPEERLEKGKNEAGTIKISIKLAENKINVTLNDDGRGLDFKKIADKAIENNIIKEEDANNTDMLIKAIFAPGFSTSETEDLHAGRGIGLNLVRDRVKEVNGSIKLRSETDKGIVFFISIPLVDQDE
jgi:two-component system chemotaxis sensor kinase CheA